MLGYPIPVREDGTVSLPLVNPVSVTGMTVQEAEEAIRKAYTVTQPILQPGRERILVALQRRRTHHVIVYRDEQQNFNNPGSEASTVVLAATQKRGTGHSLDLPAGENDVLNALARSGGPPGLDAANEIIIEHRPRPADKDEPKVAPVIRIPLTHPSGAMPDIRPEDVILRDGDVVRIVDRDIERFYTGGLLPAGEFVLPRNYDLDVIQAMSFVKGPLVNGAFGPFGGAGISGTMIAPGLGGPSPSKLTILRRTPTGSQVAISVDLNAALHDPSERLLIKAGDVLILQETRCQAVARYAGMVFDKLTFNFSFQHNNQSGFNAAAFGGNLPGR